MTIFDFGAKAVLEKAQAIFSTWSAGEPIFSEYENDPVGYSVNILGVNPWEIQASILESLVENPQTAVTACYASGKTYLAAIAVNWWLDTRKPALVVTTAPTDRQVRELLWRYVKKLRQTAKSNLGGKLLQKKLELSVDRYGFGFAGSSDSTQGIHEAKNVLFIVDEAAKMKQEVLESMEGITTASGSRRLDIGNPNNNNSLLYRAFHDKKEKKLWKTFSISVYDTPNIKAQANLIPGLVAQDWVDRVEEKYGRDSIFWRTVVMGEFMREEEVSVVPTIWVQQAMDQGDDVGDMDDFTDYDVVFGVDYGQSKDLSVLTLRAGPYVKVLDSWKGDARVCVDKIGKWARVYAPVAVNVDTTAAGEGVAQLIKERQREYRKNGGKGHRYPFKWNFINFQKSPRDKKRHKYITDELQYRMRDFFNPGFGDTEAVLLPSRFNKYLIEELPVRQMYIDQQDRERVESKVDLKNRGVRSPNFADSVMCCFSENRRLKVVSC